MIDNDREAFRAFLMAHDEPFFPRETIPDILRMAFDGSQTDDPVSHTIIAQHAFQKWLETERTVH